jgi:hypothetical protein
VSVPAARTTYRVELRSLRIDPAFLAAVINFYVINQGRRAQIGTLAEHERLLTDIGVIH